MIAFALARDDPDASRPADALSLASPPPGPGLAPEAVKARRRRLARLGEEIARLSAHIQAASYRLLELIRAFDDSQGWHEEGFRSCAEWLSWRTGIGPGAAREKVRVARALGELPELSAALRAGELSYPVARALTRVATPENEADLVEAARHSTAADMERLVGAWRAADRSEARERAEERERHESRGLCGWSPTPTAPGSCGGGWTPRRARCSERRWRRPARRSTGGPPRARFPPKPAGPTPWDSWPRALAEGLGVGTSERKPSVEAEEAGAPAIDGPEDAPLEPGSVVGRSERFQVVVHVSAETLAGPGTESSAAEDAAGEEATGAPEPPWIECGPHVSAETARRLACDAGLVTMTHDEEGRAVDVGRRRRTVPTALRRALDHRDGGCRFPGCTARFCDAHHVVPWARGGETRLGNLLLLCRHHHRRVHEDGWRVNLKEGGEARFRRPDGRLLPRVPDRPPAPEDPTSELERRNRGLRIGPRTPTPRWTGERMDTDWALFTLRRPARPDPPAG